MELISKDGGTRCLSFQSFRSHGKPPQLAARGLTEIPPGCRDDTMPAMPENRRRLIEQFNGATPKTLDLNQNALILDDLG